MRFLQMISFRLVVTVARERAARILGTTPFITIIYCIFAY